MPAKEIMKTPMPAPPPPAAANPYGQYSNQYGMPSSATQQQQVNTFGGPVPPSHQPLAQPMYNSQPSTFGAPAVQPQPVYDQHPPAPAPMMPLSYGQPSTPHQQQQPPTGMYGQAPQQQQQPQYGFNPQQQQPPPPPAGNPYGQAPAYPPQPGYY